MDFNFFSIPYLILMSFQFLWTVKTGFNVSMKSDELCLELSRWKDFEFEGISFIEMNVLENTVRKFKLNENIDAVV
jgi:hypothetical protein